MTNTKQRYGARPDGPTASSFNSPFNFHQLFGTTAKAHASGWQQIVRMNKECLEFLNRRLERDRDLSTDLVEMKAPAEAWSAWIEFYQAAQRDYAEEARRLTELFAGGAREATADLQQHLKETVALVTNDALAAASAKKAEAA